MNEVASKTQVTDFLKLKFGLPELESQETTGDTFNLDISDHSIESSRIYKAIMRRDPKFLLCRLQLGDKVNVIDSEFQTGFLHVLVTNTNQKDDKISATMVYLLSNAGINVNLQDYRGMSALDIAVEKELELTCIALLRVGCECEQLSSENKRIDKILRHFRPGLWKAVERHDGISVYRLVRSWCRVRVSRDGMSLLRLAREIGSRSGHRYDVITTLEENQSSCEYAHAALAGDQNRLIELLPNKNINLSNGSEDFGNLTEEIKKLGHLHLIHLTTKLGMMSQLSQMNNNNNAIEEIEKSKRDQYQNISRLKPKPKVESSPKQVQSEVCVIL